MELPQAYKWLEKEGSPRILLEALKLHGTKEIVGATHNPEILKWAAEIGGWVAKYYKSDEIAWCGLFVGICAKRADFPFNQTLLSAKAWLDWGNPIYKPSLGDVLIFNREGGGHVGFYVGEDEEAYHVLGGNQGNAVSVSRVPKKRFAAARRCKWRLSQPSNIRQVFLSPTGALSTNEA